MFTDEDSRLTIVPNGTLLIPRMLLLPAGCTVSFGVRLHEALDKAGVTNELYTIKGGGHGQFKEEDNRRGYAAVWQFLAKLNLGPVK